MRKIGSPADLLLVLLMNRPTFLKVSTVKNQVWRLFASLLIGLSSVCNMSDAEEVEPASAGSNGSGFAVVELFTSQGCSSCPPADRVLSKLAQTIGADQPVFLLSFHVDYWNRLGWDDPYSLAESTARQREYARAWASRQVYTPQMVVNGTWEFNGGSEQKARLAVKEGLAGKAAARIRLRSQVDGNAASAKIGFQIDGAVDNHRLNVALVSPEARNEVPRGENRGRKLSHVNVVRFFESHPLKQNSGQIELSIPADFDRESGVVIAYVQRRNDAVLTGVASTPLKNP